MKCLILGGTKFLGRYLVEAALARNHQVTLFNRQQTNPDLFSGVEKLRGNRDGDLRMLHGRKWDVVIDTCGYSSGKVRATAELLAGCVGHCTFVSSISVYRNFAVTGLDEAAPVEVLPSGAGEDENDVATYGARKALCEQVAEEAMPGRVLSVRPGIIVGPHDGTGRFLYWVRRMASGGEVLAPGKPDALVQLIDVRDLSAWIIRMVEAGNVGRYNATGPAAPLTFAQMLEQCKIGTRSDARLTWVDDQFLLDRGVKPFSDLPLWLPVESHKGHFAVDCRRAVAAGLVFRPLKETVADALRWDRAAGIQNQCGLSPVREQELLEAWKGLKSAPI